MPKVAHSPFRVRRRRGTRAEAHETKGRPPTLVDNPFAAFEDKADPQVPTATLQIYAHIDEVLGRREVDTHVNRASSSYQCVKRRWYQKQGVSGTALTPRKSVNFLLGDLSERVLLHFISEACLGPGKLYSEVRLGREIGSLHFQGRALKIYAQERLELSIGNLRVTAHADGFGRRNSDGKWELIECKSSSDWGFDSFRKNGPEEYLKQSTTLMQTTKARELGVKSVRFFFLKKQTGHIWDQVHGFDPALWEIVQEEFTTASRKKEPKAPFDLIPQVNRRVPTGSFIAQFPCTYCPFLERCHGEHEVEWKGDRFGHMKPVYVFKKGVRE